MVVRLWDGEVVIKSDGLYTFVHRYEHPHSKRKVVIAGMYHNGDGAYYASIRKILSVMDVVLYEGPPVERRKRKKCARQLLKKSKVITLVVPKQKRGTAWNKRFFALFGLYNQLMAEYCGLVPQGRFFNYLKEGWICGDAEWYTEAPAQFDRRIGKYLARFPAARKRAIAEYIKKDLRRVEKGIYTRHDYRKSTIFIWSDVTTRRMFQNLLGTFRDKMNVACFDKIVQKRAPRRIGIMFGAGHVATQRKLLEQRGYLHKGSQEFCAITF